MVLPKSAESSCDHVLRSALIQFQNTAKAKGANAVTNIVSYYKGTKPAVPPLTNVPKELRLPV